MLRRRATLRRSSPLTLVATHQRRKQFLRRRLTLQWLRLSLRRSKRSSKRSGVRAVIPVPNVDPAATTNAASIAVNAIAATSLQLNRLLRTRQLRKATLRQRVEKHPRRAKTSANMGAVIIVAIARAVRAQNPITAVMPAHKASPATSVAIVRATANVVIAVSIQDGPATAAGARIAAVKRRLFRQRRQSAPVRIRIRRLQNSRPSRPAWTSVVKGQDRVEAHQ